MGMVLSSFGPDEIGIEVLSDSFRIYNEEGDSVELLLSNLENLRAALDEMERYLEKRAKRGY